MAWRIAGYYLLYFAAVGITLPFLPAYYQQLGFTGAQRGLLLATPPVCALLFPPFWGRWADTSGHRGIVLTVVTTGATLAYLPLAHVHSFWVVWTLIALNAVFSTSVTTVLDSMAIHSADVEGGTFARLRVYGSIGFALATAVFGACQTEVTSAVIAGPTVLVGLSAVWCALFLRPIRHPTLTRELGQRPRIRTMLRQPAVLVVLGAGLLHWVACVPYHSALAILARDAGLPMAATGWTAAAGVMSEIVAISLWHRTAARLSPQLVLATCFAVSALRWLAMASVPTVGVFVGMACLHGLTFGVFYVTSVAVLTRQLPSSQRSTTQALFVASVYGVGGILGQLLAGTLADRFGVRALFSLGGAAELLPLCAVIGARRILPTSLRQTPEQGATT